MKKRKTAFTILAATCLMATAMGVLTSCTSVKPDSGKPGEDISAPDVQTATLSKIEIKQQPTKVDYKVNETVDLSGINVVAMFSDGTSKDVTSEIKTDIEKVTRDTTSIRIGYTYEGKTKYAFLTITVENPVTTEELTEYTYPRTIAMNSQADLLFMTYYDSTTMKCNGVMEMNYDEADKTKGIFTFTEQATSVLADLNDPTSELIEKINVVSGDFIISGETVSFLTNYVGYTAGSNKFTSGYEETATFVKDESDNIIGMKMGKMLKGDDLFFGWGKTKADQFVDGLGLKYGLEAYEVYFESVVDHKIPEDVVVYYKSVDSVQVNTAPTKVKYLSGEYFEMSGLTLLVSYDIGTTEVIDSGFTVDKEGALTLADNTVTVTYEGKSVTLSIEVVEPQESVLTSLEVADFNETAKVTAYKNYKVSDLLGNYTVTAVYSDNEDNKVITSANGLTITGADADVVLGADGTFSQTITFSYTDGEITKTVEKTISVSLYTPKELAQVSQADQVFFTYFKKESKNDANVNATLELFKDGTFYMTARMGSAKGSVIKGKYVIADGVISFTNVSARNYLGASAMFVKSTETDVGDGFYAQADESASIVYAEDNKTILGFNFGMIKTENFFGYSTNTSFIGIYAVFGGDTTCAYMAEVSTIDFDNDTVKANIYY